MSIYLSPDTVRVASWRLARQILNDKDTFTPDWMVVLWRGGAMVGLYVQEYLQRQGGIPVDHIAIRTSHYMGPNETKTIEVYNLGYLIHASKPEHRLLIVDDIFDSGRSMEAFLVKLRSEMGDQCPKTVRIATLCWKPEHNKTSMVPDYYEFSVPGDQWVVFPHEISDFMEDDMLESVMGTDTLHALHSTR